MQVVQIDTGLLNLPEYNVRSNTSRTEVTSLVKSITETGIVEPLIVRKVGEKYDIISGGRRFIALKSMGETSIPCIVSNIAKKQAIIKYLRDHEEPRSLNPMELAKTIKENLGENFQSIAEFANNDEKKIEYYEKVYSLLDLPIELQTLIERNIVKYTVFLTLLQLDAYKDWKNTSGNDPLKTKLRNRYMDQMRQIWREIQRTDESLKSEIDKKVKLQNYIYSVKKSRLEKVLEKPKEEMLKAANNLCEVIRDIKGKCNLFFEMKSDEDIQKNAERFHTELKEKIAAEESAFIDKSEIGGVQFRINFRKQFLGAQTTHKFGNCICGDELNLDKINSAQHEDLLIMDELKKKHDEKRDKSKYLYDLYNPFRISLTNYLSAKENYDELVRFYNAQ